MKAPDLTSRHGGKRPVGKKIDTPERATGSLVCTVNKQEVLLN